MLSVTPKPEAVSRLFMELAKLTIDLMAMGIWIRGGASLGPISKRETTPWGPAVVAAYKFESTLEVNSRIALDKMALKFIQESMTKKEDNKLIVRDDDGVWSSNAIV